MNTLYKYSVNKFIGSALLVSLIGTPAFADWKPGFDVGIKEKSKINHVHEQEIDFYKDTTHGQTLKLGLENVIGESKARNAIVLGYAFPTDYGRLTMEYKSNQEFSVELRHHFK